MKKINYYLTTLLLLSPLVTNANSTQELSTTNNELNYTGGADAQQYRSIVLSSSQFSLYLCNSDKVEYNLAKIDMIPQIPYSNMTFQSGPSSYNNYLFESTITSYKIVPWYSSTKFNGANMGPTNDLVPRSIYKQETTAWDGRGSPIMNDDRKMRNNIAATGGVRVNHGFYIYKGTERVPEGKYTLAPINGNKLMDYNCIDDKGNIQETISIIMKPITSIQTVTSCVPDKKIDKINMDPVALATLEAANSSGGTVGTKSYSFGLKCDPNVAVNFSLVDLLDTSNVSYISKLSNDSTAKGVGYTVSYGSRALRFGPDISSAFPSGDTTVDRILIKRTEVSGANIPVSYSLNFSYAPTGETLSQGTANSTIGITYSYQ
ncbi:hypothetical protein RHO12_02845 [Orbus sturtevantii]|uniref:hypothetical protein n=1 Tax=Orbus sturtevantii TaxID=3074109 RepID=UPI00370D0F41